MIILAWFCLVGLNSNFANDILKSPAPYFGAGIL